MKTSILIVSYAKDLPYLRFNLQSISKFGTGFSGVTLVVPSQEASDFASLAASENCDLRTYERDSDPVKWQIHAQAQKCIADLYCPDADMILHTDSDCVFIEPVTPDDYMVNGKPVMVIKRFDQLPKDIPWRGPVRKALGYDSEYLTMMRHPSIYPRDLYSPFREHIAKLHKMPFETYVLAQKATFPWNFSEHSTLGAFAYYSGWRDRFHWIDIGREPNPHEKLRQFWSLSPIDKPQASPHGEPPCTPIDFMRKIGLA